jgi:hypothetical protein
MLAEAACSAELGDRRGLGLLALEEDRLHFDGALTFTIPLLEIELVRVSRGSLTVVWAGETARFELGPSRAQEWAEMIRHPRSIVDQLGIKPGARVLVLGVADLELRRHLKQRAGELLGREAVETAAGLDVVILGVDTPADLATVPTLEPRLARNGALWVIRPKHAEGLDEDAVVQAGRGAGLTDIKIVAFSLDAVAHKFVVPQARR